MDQDLKEHSGPLDGKWPSMDFKPIAGVPVSSKHFQLKGGHNINWWSLANTGPPSQNIRALFFSNHPTLKIISNDQYSCIRTNQTGGIMITEPVFSLLQLFQWKAEHLSVSSPMSPYWVMSNIAAHTHVRLFKPQVACKRALQDPPEPQHLIL